MTTNPATEPAAGILIPASLLPVSRREQVEGNHIRVYIASGAFIIAEQIFAINGGGENASLEERRAIADLFVRSVNQSAAVDAVVKAATEYEQAIPCIGCPWCESFGSRCTNCTTISRDKLRAALAEVDRLRKGE